MRGFKQTFVLSLPSSRFNDQTSFCLFPQSNVPTVTQAAVMSGIGFEPTTKTFRANMRQYNGPAVVMGTVDPCSGAADDTRSNRVVFPTSFGNDSFSFVIDPSDSNVAYAATTLSVSSRE